MIHVEIFSDGSLADIEQKLKTAGRRILGESGRVTRASGLQIEANAKAICPVDTGHLKGTISATRLERGADYVSIGVDATASYAGYVEYGTSRQAPQAFLGPSLDRVGPDYEAGINAISDPLDGGLVATHRGRRL